MRKPAFRPFIPFVLVAFVWPVLCRWAAAQPAAETIAAPRAAAAGSLETPAGAMGYAMGFRIGEQILAEQKEMGAPIDQAALAQGLSDAVLAAKPRLDEEAFKRALEGLEAAMQKKQQEFVERMQAAAKTNLAKGAAYLEANKAKQGVTTLPSGLQYEVLKEGAGPKPAADHVVVAHYRGTHIDGKEFDGTDPKGDPASFPLRGVVPGWQEALPMMKAGSKWRIHLPPALAYGEQGSPPAIGPNEVLVFEIELISSRPAGGRK
jgi:FKBP-type peptidyl-prolyl cis-trans isomerase FklB